MDRPGTDGGGSGTGGLRGPSGPEIVVHDTGTAQRRLFGLPVEVRHDALEAMYREADAVPGSAARMVWAHDHGDAARVDTEDDRFLPALARLMEADAWGQIRDDLERGWALQRAQTPDARFPARIDVWLALGNPDARLFVDRTLGYYGMGSTPGQIWMVAWPTEYNLGRIGACATHEFSHQVRFANVPWRGIVGDWVVAEGLAEEFTLETCGAGSTGGWYADVTGAALDRATDLVMGALEVEGFARAGTYVLGDETAKSMGGDPVGMPHMGGYAVGLRIVRQYLAASGASIGEAMLLPAATILSAAAPQR